MRKLSYIYFFMSILFSATAQENKYLIGVVYDSKSKETLAAASVYYLNDYSKGTITNNNGEFIIEKSVIPDSIIISYLGYVTKKYDVNQMPEKIALEPFAVELQEITISPGYAIKIVKQIWEKYNKIYKIEEKKKDKQENSFFYRQITKSDSVYNEFIESFFSGGNGFSVKNLKIQEGRYAKCSEDGVYTFVVTNFFNNSHISPFLPKKPSRNQVNTFAQPNFENIYDVYVEELISTEDTNDILVLNFTPKKNNKEKYIISGLLYVRESDLSIVRFEGSLSDLGFNDARISNMKFTFRVNYKESLTDNYPIAENINCKLNMNMLFADTLHRIEVVSVLFCENQIFTTMGKKMKQNANLREEISKKRYNAEFWEKHPIIKRTKIEEEAINFFENNNFFRTFQLD